MKALSTYSRSAAICVAMGLFIGAKAAYADDTAPLVSAMQQAGEARVAIASAPPWAYSSPTGEPKGYLIDVAEEVLKAWGIPKLSATVTTWDAMIPGLDAKQFDFVPSGLNITAARCEVVAFSAPVSAQQDALYVRPDDSEGLTGYASFIDAPDRKLAILSGSSQEAFAQKAGVQRDQLVIVPDIQAGIAAVLGSRADAFAVGQFSVPDPEKRGVKRIVDENSPVVSIGIVFRKSDRDARDAFNQQLDVLRSNGTLEQLYAQKYGFPNWSVLADLSRASDVIADCD